MRSGLPNLLTAAILVGGGLWVGWLGQRHMDGIASLIDRVETVMLDWRIHLTGSRKAPDDVVIVAIDDETVGATGSYSVDRARLATLVNRIKAAGARALAVDILLVGPSQSGADARLREALGSIPSVIAAAGQAPIGAKRTSLVPDLGKLLLPLPYFAFESSTGFVNVSTDAGGTPRYVPMLFRTPERLEQSFALRAAGLFVGEWPSVAVEEIRLKEHEQKLDLGWHLPLNYYGPRGSVKTISAMRFFDKSLDPADIDGKLVVLGITATGVGDRFGTPFDAVMPGVEVQATAIANLLDGSALIRSSRIRSVDVAAAFWITGFGILAAALLPLPMALLAFIGLVGGWMVSVTFLFGHGYWFNGALSLAASLPPVFVQVLVRQILDRSRTRRLVRVQEALSRFQAPAIARRIAEDPSFLLVPKEQMVAILFIDLTGYTSLSERFGPARTRDVLKAFHTHLVNETSGKNGIVLDFMGDGAMLGFGIPDSSPKDAANACQCAFDLAKCIGGWIDDAGLEKEISGVRIGGHYGPVVLSRLGHEHQQQIAATGDSVNVASRLLEVASGHHSAVALSGELIRAANLNAGSEFPRPYMATSEIRGRRKLQQVGLWRLPDILPARSADLSLEEPQGPLRQNLLAS